MIHPRSLRQRFLLFMFLPVGFLLLGMGYAGFFFARDNLIDQWKEAAVLKLGRSAHSVDMRLNVPKEWMRMYFEAAGRPSETLIQDRVLERLRTMDGIARVKVTWVENKAVQRISGEQDRRRPNGNGGRRRFFSGRIAAITPPVYDPSIDQETVTLISELKDEQDVTVGRIEVVIWFDYLVQDVMTSGWWRRQKAYLVDDSGDILTCTLVGNQRKFCEMSSPLHQETLAAMKEKPFGTLLGAGHPPSEVSGFYRLEQAPWTLIIVAPGREILSPIVRFAYYYIATAATFIVFILLLIRRVTRGTVSAIKEVSQAARDVARGRYGTVLPVETRDEVGELTRSFNIMVRQLKDRLRLKEAMDLAVEVQQNFLPQKAFRFGNLDIAGKSIYCDETGGDYYDFLEFSELGQNRIGIAVGDVAGHGIASALLMTTSRALLRGRIVQPGELSAIMGDLNRLLYQDTSQTGNFMTLFLAVIDTDRQEIQWIRAGHEPALVYDSRHDRFEELKGRGLALGVDESFEYDEHATAGFKEGQILLIGTDGIWETQNPFGEMFGKERLKDLVRRHSNASSERIITAVMNALNEFVDTAVPEDDITLVVVRYSV